MNPQVPACPRQNVNHCLHYHNFGRQTSSILSLTYTMFIVAIKFLVLILLHIALHHQHHVMSPKYYKCLPSVLVNDNCFTGASSNGLFLLRSSKLGSALLNPTTGEYIVELVPRLDTMLLHSGMWYDHKCDDYKLHAPIY